MDTTSSSPASTLRLSPFTPSLTASPTISSTVASPLLFPECFPNDAWLPTDIAPWLLSTPHDISPAAIFLNPDDDVRPKKKPRHSAKLDHEPLEAMLPRSQPAMVAIPPAQACDIPHDLVKRPIRKRNTARAARSKLGRPKETSQAPASQPIRFRFVSVQHSETAQPDVPAEFEERMEEDIDDGPFDHGPSELPPRPYPGGEYAVSPLEPAPKTGKIPASSLDFLPVLEARFSQLENAIERYVELRAQMALRNSILPDAQREVPPPPPNERWKIAPA